MKILDILRKLGIYRSGSFSGTYTAKDRPVEMLMDDVYDAKKDLTTKEDLKNVKEKLFNNKKNKEEEKSDNSSNSSSNGDKEIEIRFWVSLVIAIFFMLALWGSGITFWSVIGILLWIVLLFWLRRGEGRTVSTGVVIGAVAGLIFASFILVALSSPDSGVIKSDFNVNVNKDNGGLFSSENSSSSQMNQEEINTQAVLSLLNSLGKNIKVESTQAVPMASVVWTTANTSLVLQNSYSVTLKGMDASEVDNLREYFEKDLKATTGGTFEFVPPVNTVSAGFLVSNEQFSSLMCVFTVEEMGKGEIIVSCGYGPGGKANFVK